MKRVVHKYGGSSVKEVGKLKAVAAHIAQEHREGKGVVVVVSAMGNTTNELLGLARSVTKSPKRRELDMLVSVGERIAMSLLSMAIDAEGVPAVSFTGSQSGIITDESHSNARVIEVRPYRIERALSEGKVAIVAGFQGVSREREVTTLGRGGSDTTAVALAAALDAAWCEIHSDVPGLFSADPRSVPEAIKLDHLSLEEALLMARHGARVLHDEALAYAKRHGISIVSSSADGGEVGTRIEAKSERGGVVAISGESELERIESDDPVSLLAALEAADAPIKRIANGEVLVNLRDWPDRASFEMPEGARSLGATGRVSAVGVGVGCRAELTLAAIEVLAAEEIPFHSNYTSAGAINFELDGALLGRAERALHAALITSREG